MPKPTVFISHSHYDNEWCLRFVAGLQLLGYDVWYDEKELSGGAQWVRTIERELEGREIFAIILTPQSWESDWVQQELQLALTTRRRVVPILLKETTISGFLRTYQNIDATQAQVWTVATAFDAAVDSDGTLGRGVTGLYGGIVGGISHDVQPVEHGIGSRLPGHHTPDAIPGKASLGDLRNAGVAGMADSFVSGAILEVQAVEHGIGSHVPGHYNQATPTKQPRLVVVDGESTRQQYVLARMNTLTLDRNNKLNVQSSDGPSPLLPGEYLVTAEITQIDSRFAVIPLGPIEVNGISYATDTQRPLTDGDRIVVSTISYPGSPPPSKIIMRFEYS